MAIKTANQNRRTKRTKATNEATKQGCFRGERRSCMDIGGRAEYAGVLVTLETRGYIEKMFSLPWPAKWPAALRSSEVEFPCRVISPELRVSLLLQPAIASTPLTA